MAREIDGVRIEERLWRVAEKKRSEEISRSNRTEIMRDCLGNCMGITNG
jgi:hypothetical protein